jgi:hypothetical protein
MAPRLHPPIKVGLKRPLVRSSQRALRAECERLRAVLMDVRTQRDEILQDEGIKVAREASPAV